LPGLDFLIVVTLEPSEGGRSDPVQRENAHDDGWEVGTAVDGTNRGKIFDPCSAGI
jgi:hypothetical protein